MRLPTIGARRVHAERYLLLVVVAFGVSVAGTRLFLSLTGYPKVGGGGLHVAHMLWGGLLQVVASLLPLLLSGRRVLALSALAGGVGVGLFIDEVGKFITERNDYFFAPAAPLIYGAVLLLAGLWAVVRQRSRRSAGSAEDALHAGGEALFDAADGTLTGARRDAVVAHLRSVAAAGDPRQAPLAGAVATLLSGPEMEARLAAPGWLDHGGPRRLLDRVLPPRLAFGLLIVLLALTALLALWSILLLLALLGVDALPMPDAGPVEFPDDPVWLAALLVVAIGVGVAGGVAAVLLLTGRRRAGIRIGIGATLVNLVAGGLLTFYVTQFESMLSVVLHLAILGLLVDVGARGSGGAADAAVPGAVAGVPPVAGGAIEP